MGEGLEKYLMAPTACLYLKLTRGRRQATGRRLKARFKCLLLLEDRERPARQKEWPQSYMEFATRR